MTTPAVERRSDPRRGLATRVGLVLAATGTVSAALARRALSGSPPDVPLAVGFGLFLALLLLATFKRPPRGADWLSLGCVAVVYFLAGVALANSLIGMTAYIVAAALATWATAPQLRIFTVAAFALWTPALRLFGPTGGLDPIPVPLLLAADLALVFTFAVVVDRRPIHPSDRLRRVGYGLLAIACVATVVDRHLVVGSPGLAPDDALAVAVTILLPLLAYARLRPGIRDAVVTGLVLGTFALTGLALIVGKPYHVDAVTAPHRAAELLLAGQDPYATFDLVEALARFGLDPQLATHFEDGTVVHTYNYPALSFLVVAPFVALGLADVRWVYLAEILAVALLVARRLRFAWRPMALVAVVGNGIVVRQNVLAGIDPTWALLVLGAWFTLGRRWLSPILIGLAVASRQPAWFVAPFYLVAVWQRSGPREAWRHVGVAALTAFAVNLPFFVGAPERFVVGVSAPLIAPLATDGVGLVRYGLEGVLPLFPRIAYTALSLGALAGLIALVAARGRELASAPLVWPFFPLYLAWRSLQNYFGLGPLFAFGADDELVGGTISDRAGGPAVARDPGVPGGPRGGS